MNKPKLLIDTNILIALEDDRRVDQSFAKLSQSCQLHGIQLYVHEISKQDIERDKDQSRKAIILSKLEKFIPLEGIRTPEVELLSAEYGTINKPNDYVDCALLYALNEINAVDFLITQDKGIHSRAERIGIGNRVFRCEDVLAWMRDKYEHSQSEFYIRIIGSFSIADLVSLREKQGLCCFEQVKRSRNATAE